MTTPVAVMIENETRTSRTSRSTAPLVERSSQIEVKVPPIIPTARFQAPTPIPTARRQIVVEIITPALVPTPLAIEPEEVEEPEDEAPPEVTPQPEPTPAAASPPDQAGGSPDSI